MLPARTYANLRAIKEAHDTGTKTTPSSIGSRIRFALYEGRRYTDILSRITVNNGRLEKIIASLQVLAPSFQEARPNHYKLCAPHLNLRPFMHTLYLTLAKLWPCDCRH